MFVKEGLPIQNTVNAVIARIQNRAQRLSIRKSACFMKKEVPRPKKGPLIKCVTVLRNSFPFQYGFLGPDTIVWRVL